MTTLTELLKLLRQRVGFEVVQQQEEPHKIYLMGRVHGHTGNIRVFFRGLLMAAKSEPWSVDVSQAYVLKSDQLVKGWRMIFQGDHIPEALQQITSLLMSSPVVGVAEVTEFPLAGASIHRNENINGKGAAFTGHAAIGRR